MHRGRRIKIPTIEVTGQNWRNVSVINAENLEGRPKRVLKRLVDTGIDRGWWDKEVFEELVVLVWGKDFMNNLKRMAEERRQRDLKDNGN